MAFPSGPLLFVDAGELTLTLTLSRTRTRTRTLAWASAAGANVGACTMHMLLASSAKVVSFEPNPGPSPHPHPHPHPSPSPSPPTLTLAKVISFEPSGANLFHASSSILGVRHLAPPARLRLYPIALGASNASGLLYSAIPNPAPHP